MRARGALLLLAGALTPLSVSAACTSTEVSPLLKRLETLSKSGTIDGTYLAAARIATGDLAGGISWYKEKGLSEGEKPKDPDPHLAVFLYQSRFIGNDIKADDAFSSRSDIRAWNFAEADLAQSLKIARTQIKTTGSFGEADDLIQSISDGTLTSTMYWDAIVALAGAGRVEMLEALQRNAPRTVSDLSPFIEKASQGVVVASRLIASNETDLAQKIATISDPEVAGWAAIYGVEKLSLSGKPVEAYELVSVSPQAYHRAIAMIQYLEHFGDRLKASDTTPMLDWARSNLAANFDHSTMVRLIHAYLRAGREETAGELAQAQFAALQPTDTMRPTYLALRSATDNCTLVETELDGMTDAARAETLARTIALARRHFHAERFLPQAVAAPEVETEDSTPESEDTVENEDAASKDPRHLSEQLREDLRSCAKEVQAECLIQFARGYTEEGTSSPGELVQLAWIEAAGGEPKAAEETLLRAFPTDKAKAYVATASLLARAGHMELAQQYAQGFNIMPELFLDAKYEEWLGPLLVAFAREELSKTNPPDRGQIRRAMRHLSRLDGPDSKELFSGLRKNTRLSALNMAWEKNADQLVHGLFDGMGHMPPEPYAKMVAQIRSLEITPETGSDVLESLMEFNETLPEGAQGPMVFFSRAISVGNFETAMEILRSQKPSFRIAAGKWIVSDEHADQSLREEVLSMIRSDLDGLPEGVRVTGEKLWVTLQDYKAANNSQRRLELDAEVDQLSEQALSEAKSPRQRNTVLAYLSDAGFYSRALTFSSMGPKENIPYNIYEVLQDIRGF